MNVIKEQLAIRTKLFKHIKTALVVGVILNVINQNHLIWGFDWHKLEISRMVLTFLVPFSVSVYSAATSNPSTEQHLKSKPDE